MANVTAEAMSIVFTAGAAAASATSRPRRVMLDSLEVDATLSEVVSSASELTQHPIETGATVSDHVIERPREYRMEGVITNAPLSVSDRLDAGRIAWADLSSSSPAGTGNKVDGAYSLLEQMKASRDVVTIRTPLRIFTDMVMVSLQVTRDPKTGDALQFSAAFQQVRKAKSVTVAPASIPRAAPTSQAGRLPTTIAPASVESDTTFLRELSDGAGITPKK